MDSPKVFGPLKKARVFVSAGKRPGRRYLHEVTEYDGTGTITKSNVFNPRGQVISSLGQDQDSDKADTHASKARTENKSECPYTDPKNTRKHEEDPIRNTFRDQYFDDKGNLFRVFESQRNGQNDLSKVVVYDGKSNVIEIRTYTYENFDEFGNWQRKVTWRCRENCEGKEVYTIEERELEYRPPEGNI